MLRVLNYGPHRALQAVRAQILARAGCEVASPSSQEEVLSQIQTGNYDVLVIWYEVDDKSAYWLSAEFRRANPAGRVVAVHSVPWKNMSEADANVAAHDPKDLIAAVTADSQAQRIAWQHERRLMFDASDKWTGWLCERCCWNRRQPESIDQRAALALKIHSEFVAHSCEAFARENWSAGTSLTG